MALYEPLAHCRARGHQSQSGLLTITAAGRNGLDSCNIANALTDRITNDESACVHRSKSLPQGAFVRTIGLERKNPIDVAVGWHRLLARFLFQLPNPLLQELPFWFLLGQRQGTLISGPSLSCPTEPAVHIRAG